MTHQQQQQQQQKQKQKQKQQQKTGQLIIRELRRCLLRWKPHDTLVLLPFGSFSLGLGFVKHGMVDNNNGGGNNNNLSQEKTDEHELDLSDGVSDIDLLLIGPTMLQRHEIFGSLQDVSLEEANSNVSKPCSFVAFLQKYLPKPLCNVVVLPNAHVPIVKFWYRNVQIDLVYCQSPKLLNVDVEIEIDTVTDNDTDVMNRQLQTQRQAKTIKMITAMASMWTHRDLDEKSALSLNGWLVTEALLKFVNQPQPSVFTLQSHSQTQTQTRYQEFIQLLSVIKRWAKRRGIYGSNFRFPGGVSWALLVLYFMFRDVEPLNDDKSEIQAPTPTQVSTNMQTLQLRSALRNFFAFYASFPWQTTSIVLLCSLRNTPSAPRQQTTNNLALCHYKKCTKIEAETMTTTETVTESSAMRVYTPGPRAINSTFNVTHTTLSILQDEFHRAHQITAIVPTQGLDWVPNALCQLPHDFFQTSAYFVEIGIRAREPEHIIAWSSWVESNLPKLIHQLQFVGWHPRPWSHLINDQNDNNNNDNNRNTTKSSSSTSKFAKSNNTKSWSSRFGYIRLHNQNISIEKPNTQNDTQENLLKTDNILDAFTALISNRNIFELYDRTRFSLNIQVLHGASIRESIRCRFQ